jgi:hypothetical protein
MPDTRPDRLPEERYGAAEAEALMAAMNERPPVTIRNNTLRATREALAARLRDEELAETHPTPLAPDGLVVERGGASTTAAIATVTWRGMRCRVSVTTNDPSVQVDLRLNWKQPTTSLAASPKEVGQSGEASLAVADDSHEGAAATVVVVDTAGNVLDRKPTTVGEAT